MKRWQPYWLGAIRIVVAGIVWYATESAEAVICVAVLFFLIGVLKKHLWSARIAQ